MKYAAVFEYANHDQIPETRPLHREYLGNLKERGMIVVSGPFLDDSGALIVYETDSQEAAEQLIEEDPFRIAGVFKSYSIKPWNQVF